MQRHKYPKTMHLPWSPGLQNDDRLLPDVGCFSNKTCVVTEKLDGENTTIYSDGYIHARSIDGRDHPSRSWIKSKVWDIAWKLPDGWRLCGENMYAKHSIHYTNLESYFYVFAIFNKQNVCMPWDFVEYIAKQCGLPTVPIITVLDISNSELLEDWLNISDNKLHNMEGYVIRNTSSFRINEWNENIAKYVRKNHIQTDKNWMTQPVVPNKLKDKT